MTLSRKMQSPRRIRRMVLDGKSRFSNLVQPFEGVAYMARPDRNVLEVRTGPNGRERFKSVGPKICFIFLLDCSTH